MEATLVCVADVLAAQRGLITWSQLRDAGVHEDRVRRLVVRGVLRRVRPKIYALAGAPESWERELQAAVFSIGGAAASHSSAARLWRYVRMPAERLEVSTGRQNRTEVPGVRVHRSRHLTDLDLGVVSGIRCTTFERTLCDCTTMLSEFQLSRVLDDGLRRGVASVARLRDCAERLESGPGRHMSVVRSLLADRDATYDPGGSASELSVLEVIRRARLPEPVQQHRVNVGGHTYFLDYAWPVPKVFAEYYGLPFHIGASAVAWDSERLSVLAAAGWLPLVFTSASSERQIIEQISAALVQRGVGTATGA